MVYETTLVFQTADPIRFTVADGTSITKGAILKLTDPMTAIINTAANDVIAGIAAVDKIASDGVTSLAVFREGIFRGYASGSITVGDPIVTTATQNCLASALNTGLISGSKIVGVSLETATDAQTFLFELRPLLGTGQG